MARTKGALGMKNRSQEIEGCDTIQVDKRRVDGSIDILTVNGNVRTFSPVQNGIKIYEFPNGRQLEVTNSKFLNTDEGGHRIICEDGSCFYIKPSESWFVTWRNYTMLDENYRF